MLVEPGGDVETTSVRAEARGGAPERKVCSVCGLNYPASAGAGCPRCRRRREEGAAAPKAAAPSTVVPGVVLLAFASVCALGAHVVGVFTRGGSWSVDFHLACSMDRPVPGLPVAMAGVGSIFIAIDFALGLMLLLRVEIAELAAKWRIGAGVLFALVTVLMRDATAILVLPFYAGFAVALLVKPGGVGWRVIGAAVALLWVAALTFARLVPLLG